MPPGGGGGGRAGRGRGRGVERVAGGRRGAVGAWARGGAVPVAVAAGARAEHVSFDSARRCEEGGGRGSRRTRSREGTPPTACTQHRGCKTPWQQQQEHAPGTPSHSCRRTPPTRPAQAGTPRRRGPPVPVPAAGGAGAACGPTPIPCPSRAQARSPVRGRRAQKGAQGGHRRGGARAGEGRRACGRRMRAGLRGGRRRGSGRRRRRRRRVQGPREGSLRSGGRARVHHHHGSGLLRRG